MQRKVGLILLATVSSLALFSCGTQNVGQTNLPDKNAASFKLDVSEDSYLLGASASGFSVDVEDKGRDILVNINVENAQRLTAVYFELQYDAEQYRPITALPTDAMGSREDMLRLNYMKDRGTLHYGQLLTNPQLRSGFTGSGTVTQVMFRKEATPPVRTVSAPPSSAQSNPVLSINGAGDTLSWGFFNQGDYDQNGRVAVQDLTPIGLNFQDTVDDAPDGPKAVVDGNNDGTISVQDLTPIGVNFGRRLESYNVYASTDLGDKNATNADPSTITEVQNILLSAATPNPVTGGRKLFTATVPVENTMLYWVRAVDETGAEGATSNVATNVPGALPTLVFAQAGTTNGDGLTAGTPEELTAGDTYQIIVNSPAPVTDVSVDPQTVITIHDVNRTSGAADPTLTVGATQVDLAVPADFAGTFQISATYQGNAASPANLFFVVGGGGGGGDLFIRPMPGDPNWAGVPNFGDTGAGETSADAYVMHDSTFNTVDEGDGTFSLAFAMEASDVSDFSNDVAENTLDWAVFPPDDGPQFLVEWVNTPEDGVFKVNFLTNCEIIAIDGAQNESNHIFIFSQLDQ
ncbi:hypothetical protein IT575_00680 [bacterium]|nr:hypothetical protein [bacterium]